MKRFDGALFVALLIPIAALLPLAQQPGIPNLADALIHLLRQVDFDRVLRGGTLVPRWAPDLYLGYGYPLYVFAPPLLAYAMELFHLAGLAMDDALKLCVILIFELYSVGMFLFMRPKVGTRGALIAAALNVYAPFRLREALVTGGNYPQFLALALLPLCLWAFDGIVRTRARGYVIAAGLSSAALVLSHLFQTLIFAPVIALYALARLWQARATRGTWALVVLAGMLGLLLSAFFWLPLLTERPLVRATAEAFVRASDFHQRFLSGAQLLAPPLPLDAAEANVDVPLSLGWAQLALGVLGIGAVAWCTWRVKAQRSLLDPLFLLGLLLLSVSLQLPFSTPLWDNVSLLGLAEFPWRFMGISVFALAALGGYVTLIFPRGDRHGILPALALCVIVASAFPYLHIPRGFVALGTPSPAQVLAYEQSTGALGLTTLSEYLPLFVQQVPNDGTAPLGASKLDPRSLRYGARVQSADWSPLDERVVIQSDQPLTVRFLKFNYPGWLAYVDEQKTAIITQPDGTIAVALLAGEHSVQLRFEATAARRLGEGLSIVGLFLLLALSLLRTTAAAPAANTLPNGKASLVVFALTLVALALFKWGVVDAQGWLQRTRALQPVALYDQQIVLMGGEVDSASVQRGGVLHARFFWRAAQPLEKDYHVFAQLIASDGRAVAGDDKLHAGDPIVQGEVPSSRFETVQYVRDEHRIAIGTDVPSGRYELRVGWYDPATGKRLKLPNGETLFTAKMIEVK